MKVLRLHGVSDIRLSEEPLPVPGKMRNCLGEVVGYMRIGLALVH